MTIHSLQSPIDRGAADFVSAPQYVSVSDGRIANISERLVASTHRVVINGHERDLQSWLTRLHIGNERLSDVSRVQMRGHSSTSAASYLHRTPVNAVDTIGTWHEPVTWHVVMTTAAMASVWCRRWCVSCVMIVKSWGGASSCSSCSSRLQRCRSSVIFWRRVSNHNTDRQYTLSSA